MAISFPTTDCHRSKLQKGNKSTDLIGKLNYKDNSNAF